MYSSYKNSDDLYRLNPEPYDKEVVWIEDIKEYWQWDGQSWGEYSNSIKEDMGENTVASISLYDMNKQLILQAGPLPEEQKPIKQAMIINLDRINKNTYYLLYGKEISYFTLFAKERNNAETLGSLVLECVQNIGTIYSIELTEDKFAIEIWVQTNPEEVTCLYLFPYDNGIVPFGG